MCDRDYEYGSGYEEGHDDGYRAGSEDGYLDGRDSRGWELEEAYEEIAKLEAEIAKMRYFMSVRIDFDGERTVLDVFEENRDSIQ